MPVYLVSVIKNPEAINTKLKELVPEGDIYVLENNNIFIKYDGTSVELSDKAGIKDGSTGTGVIVKVDVYNGRGPQTLWEWLSQKLAK